jgi:hypothetical protein
VVRVIRIDMGVGGGGVPTHRRNSLCGRNRSGISKSVSAITFTITPFTPSPPPISPHPQEGALAHFLRGGDVWASIWIYYSTCRYIITYIRLEGFCARNYRTAVIIACMFISTLQMKGRWESNINVWLPFMHSQKCNSYFQNRIIMFRLPVPIFMYLREIYIFPGSVCLLCCREICGPILGICKSLTDTRHMNVEIGTEAVTWTGGIVFSESIPGLHKWLQIRVLRKTKKLPRKVLDGKRSLSTIHVHCRLCI